MFENPAEPAVKSNASPPPRSSSLTVLGLICIAAAAVVFLMLRNRDGEPDERVNQASRQHPAVGMLFDDIRLPPLTGDGPAIAPDALRGKVVLISFWGPWCPPCRLEFPHLVKIAEDLRSRDDFVWLPVTYSNAPNESPVKLRQSASEFLSQNGFRNVTYHDPDQSLLVRAQTVGVFDGGFPLTFLLNRHGRVRAVWNGYRKGAEREVEAAIAELLESPAKE